LIYEEYRERQAVGYGGIEKVFELAALTI